MTEILKTIKCWLVLFSIPIIMNVIGFMFFKFDMILSNLISGEDVAITFDNGYKFIYTFYSAITFIITVVVIMLFVFSMIGVIYNLYFANTHYVKSIYKIYDDAFSHLAIKYGWFGK